MTRRTPSPRATLLTLLGVLAVVVSLSGCPSPEHAPRNVVLMIADGCGFHHVDAVDLWEHGRLGAQVYESFPVRLALGTRQYGAPDYDPEATWATADRAMDDPTDSAAAITALGCGVKTDNGKLAVTTAGEPVPTFLELAEAAGLATGVVTTVPFSHATPAGLVTHAPDRDRYAAIARAMIEDSAVDVIMGCGHPWRDDDGRLAADPRYAYVGGRDVWEDLEAGLAGGDADGDGAPDPWTLVTGRDEFRALAEGATPGRVLGVPRVRETLQQLRGGDAAADPGVVPFLESVPTLSEMSLAALNVLDDDPDGFVVMIEGGAVDWACHDLQPGRMIEELEDFDAAVETVCAWIESHGGWDETLLVITADHECGGLHGDDPSDPWSPPRNNGRGVLPGMAFRDGEHSSHLVPLFAKGAGARYLLEKPDGVDPRRGWYLDNARLGRMLCAWAEGRRSEVAPDAPAATLAGR